MGQDVIQRQWERPFDGQALRQALAAFATGVTVITTRRDDRCHGMTANAFTSVSLEPALVLVCVKRSGHGSREIADNGHFAVNILRAGQEELSRFFASPDRPRGAGAFRDIPHRIGESGSPILEAVAGYLDCQLFASHEAGDHVIFVGEVLDLEVHSEASPLLFHGGRYRSLLDDRTALRRFARAAEPRPTGRRIRALAQRSSL